MVIINAYTEEEQREAFAHPCCVPGSDATTLAPDGPLAESFFHGAYTWASWFWRFMVTRAAAALAGGGSAQADRPAGRTARAVGSRRATSGRASRRHGVRPGRLR